MSRDQFGVCRVNRGLTLMEALMASAILFAVVSSLTSAIIAGQQQAFEARQSIAGALAADALIGRLSADPYANLTSWNGYTEPVGAMVDSSGVPLPNSFAMVGRDVQVTTHMQSISALGIDVRGRTVRVRAFNTNGRTVAEITQFFPEPPA